MGRITHPELPVGRTIALAFSEVARTTALAIEVDSGATRLFLRTADASDYVEYSNGFEPNNKIVALSAPGGCSLLVVLTAVPSDGGPGWNFHCHLVDLKTGERRALGDASGRREWWIARLVGTPAAAGCVLCVTGTTQEGLARYALERIDVENGERVELDGFLGSRF